ncbi:MAG: transcription termination factor Rho [Actinomycetota bacterium]|nr:transcription termination factor Rho [Actinomycetota bacterium]
MSNETFERGALDGKDREQLQAIAAALGLKAVSRLKKAELVEAILGATNGAHNGARAANDSSRDDSNADDSRGDDSRGESGSRPRKIRSTASAKSDLDALAEEEAAIAASTSGSEPEIVPVRARRPITDAAGAETAPASLDSERSHDQRDQHDHRSGDGSGSEESSGGSSTQARETSAGDGDTSGGGGPSSARDDYESAGNKRRRRRRGRDRDRDRGFEQRPEELTGDAVEVEGLLDLRDEGYGFLRTGSYLAGRDDAYVSASQVRRFALRKGDFIKGATRAAATTEKYPALMRVDEINGMTPDEARQRPRFEDLTPLFPDERLRLELPDNPLEMTGRIVDLISPIGKGQRGMVVSPPKAGKTTILKQIVYSIERNNPEVHLMVLLVDERPEEVTDMRRHVTRGEVVASTFDRPSDEHTQVAELTIERAKRLVEMGRDVVIILDGITRLARAYNLAAPASGRIMSGGIDAGALYPPKKFFGAARNVEEGGSLTIIATALVETNSKMDEHIFEEFKGTGNMELRLDRRLAERRIYPAIDVEQSSTRHEELLFDRVALQQIWKLRRVLNALEGGAGLELLIDKIRTTKSNDEFLAQIAKAPSGMGA